MGIFEQRYNKLKSAIEVNQYHLDNALSVLEELEKSDGEELLRGAAREGFHELQSAIDNIKKSIIEAEQNGD